MRDQRRSPFRAAQSICNPSPTADHSTSLEGSSFGATRQKLAALVTSYSRASASSHGLTGARLPQIVRHHARQYALRKDFQPPARLAINTVGWLAARPAYPVTPPRPDCQSRFDPRCHRQGLFTRPQRFMSSGQRRRLIDDDALGRWWPRCMARQTKAAIFRIGWRKPWVANALTHFRVNRTTGGTWFSVCLA